MSRRLELTITRTPEPRAPHVREHPPWRWTLRPLCWIRGHNEAWIKPLVPNPHAIDSWVLGCSRCGQVVLKP